MPNFRRFVPVVAPQLEPEQPQGNAPLLYPIETRSPRRRYKGRRNLQTEDEQLESIFSIEETQAQEILIPVRPMKSPALPALERSVTPKRSAITNMEEMSVYKQVKTKSPAYVLEINSNDLTEFERTEILDFPSVYYWGEKAIKNYNARAYNNGYDDERGEYLGVIGDHVAYRYELISVLGQGSFGKVFKAIDHATEQTVAVKIIKNKKKFHRQGIIEVRLLETLKKTDPQDISCTLKLTQSIYFREHLIIITEMLGINLYDMILENNMLGLSIRKIKLFAAECINALYYAEELHIIHADIKPENILLVSQRGNQVKVIDWGSGCFVNQTVYEYIESRFYRAPEVILGLPYSQPIDIWSLGCVFAELLSGEPLFAGEDELDELKRIISVLGMPPEDMIMKAPRRKEFFNDQGDLLAACIPGGTPLWRQINDANLLSLCKKMLVWSPMKRATAKELLEEPWVVDGFKDAALSRPAVEERRTDDNTDSDLDSSDIEQQDTGEHEDMVDELGFKVVMKTGSVRLPRIGEQ